MPLDLMLLFLVLEGLCACLCYSLLAWKKVKWKREDLLWMLMMRFFEDGVHEVAT